VVSFFWRSVGHEAITVYKTCVCCYITVVQDKLSSLCESRDGSMFFGPEAYSIFWGTLHEKEYKVKNRKSGMKVNIYLE